MDSVQSSMQIEPRPVGPARVDDEITLTYQKIKSVDEQIARASEQLSRLERDDTRRRRSRGRPALRGLIGLVLAAGICGAALVWQSSYRDTARLMFAGWMPMRVAMSSPSQAESTPAVQPSLAAAQPASAEAASSAPAPPAQGASETAAPAAAELPPELTELLHKMASDLANVQQGIEQLKASQEQLRANQEQMSLDNVRVADELRAGQEQVAARLVASTADKTPDRAAGKTPHQASDPNARGRTTAAPVPAPRPPVASTRKPAPAPNAAVRRPAPVQLESARQ